MDNFIAQFQHHSSETGASLANHSGMTGGKKLSKGLDYSGTLMGNFPPKTSAPSTNGGQRKLLQSRFDQMSVEKQNDAFLEMGVL